MSKKDSDYRSMYILYANDHHELSERSSVFETHMEPYLYALENHQHIDRFTYEVPEIKEYLNVCRWPFRKLEYSFAIQLLLAHLKPGDQYLDAGCGATPLPHVIAGQQIQTSACDHSVDEINGLKKLDIQSVFGANVNYLVADLTNLQFPSNSFDAISCVSVLEHIPAPNDQVAIKELLRVLKPDGLLVVTVDFRPLNGHGRYDTNSYFMKRVGELLAKGGPREVYRGLRRKQEAVRAVSQNTSSLPRSANECFRVEHLEVDISPLLNGVQFSTTIPFSSDLRSLNSYHSDHFWSLDVPHREPQGRAVLPVGFALRKTPTRQNP